MASMPNCNDSYDRSAESALGKIESHLLRIATASPVLITMATWAKTRHSQSSLATAATRRHLAVAIATIL